MFLFFLSFFSVTEMCAGIHQQILLIPEGQRLKFAHFCVDDMELSFLILGGGLGNENLQI